MNLSILADPASPDEWPAVRSTVRLHGHSANFRSFFAPWRLCVMPFFVNLGSIDSKEMLAQRRQGAKGSRKEKLEMLAILPASIYSVH
jgi:hypothetical protein